MSEFLYVPNSYDDTVSVIDTATNMVVATIPVGDAPDTAAASPDGAFVYVACESGVVSVINTATNTVGATIAVPSSGQIEIAVSPDGTLAYVTNTGSGTVSVIDTASNTVANTIDVGSAQYGIAFSPDGTRAYVTEASGTVSVIDTDSNSVLTTITVGNVPTVVAVGLDGTHVYVNNYGSGTVSVIDTASNTVANTINVGSHPYGIAVSPDGTHAYVASYDGTVSVIDTASNAVIDTISDVGPGVGIAINHDGTRLYVTHYSDSDTVSVIDTTTDLVVGTINVGSVAEYPAIVNVNDHAPIITTDAVQSVAENTTKVAALTSTDADDVGINPATFSISGGKDAALFDIAGGNLVFKSAKDFETDPHSYQVEVASFDGVNTTAKMLTVSLTDANDNAPVITSPNAQTITAVTDVNNLGNFAGFAAPLTVGIYTFTTDDGQLRYSSFGENNSYALGDNTDLGFINIAIAPGAYVTKLGFFVGLAGEAQNNSETVSFFDTDNVLLETIDVSRDGGYQFVSFETTTGFIGRVLVTDTKLNSSVVTVDNLEVQLAPAPLAVNENTTFVAALTSTDVDTIGTNPATFSIAGGTDAALFEIADGNLVFKSAKDFETDPHSYQVQISAFDGINTTVELITVNVQNVTGVSITGTSSANTIDATHTIAGQPLPTNEEDTINAGGGNDTINALGGNDFINGGAGADRMFGGTGNDTYVVDNTGDVVNETGGNGLDTVQSSITFDLSNTARVIGAVENLTLTGTAAINGTGNALANVITGNSGNNIIAGLGGADTLDGGAGSSDTATYVASSAGVNVSLMTGIGSGGDAGGDLLFNFENLTGSAKNDTLEGNSGNNVLVGGTGMDTISYQHAAAGVTVNLGVTTAQATGGAGLDTLTGFENLTGSAHDDTLTGTTGANTIIGGDGADTIRGGRGADFLIGGQDADRYVFTELADSAPGARDLITDFVHVWDTIDLSTIDANTSRGGNQAFAFGGQNTHAVADSVTWFESNGNTIVQADVNGNTTADLQIVLQGTDLDLDATDFIL